ncbi:sugar ABC transporter substrate-binding protein [bacterium]|nr:MAG: sugar ABC transporter substrate-binding protein [bacterium]
MIRLITLGALLLLILRMSYVTLRPPVEARTTGPVTIEMSVWGMPWENDLYTKLYIPEFERQNPDIRVRFHHFEDYGNRVLLSHAGGIAPDVIRENIDFSIGWTKRGLNLPLNRYINGSDGIDRKDFIPILWKGLEYGGDTYGVPQDINLLGLFYNKELFDKAGMAYPDASWTWKDLQSAAKKLTQGQTVGLDMGWGGGTFRPFVYQAGGRFWNEDGVTTAIDSPEVAEALRYYKSLMRGDVALTRSNSLRGGLGPDKFFQTGRVAMFVDGSWLVPSIKKAAPDLRFGLAPLPRGAQASTISSSCHWSVSSQTRHPEAAWKLAKFLGNTEALKEYWQMLWVAPPARWSALRSEEFKNVKGAPGKIPGIDSQAEFAEKCGWIPQVLENGWTSIEFCNPYTNRLMLHLNEAVDKVLLENADPATVLKAAKVKVDKQIAEDIASEKAANRGGA